MRIFNRAHVPWAIFVTLATLVACVLYLANFHPQRLPFAIPLPAYFGETPPIHSTVGGTPLGLLFGAIALAIFIFAAFLGVRKKLVLWRIGTVQRWLRAHIWLTLLTVPLVILHSGFRLGGPMTTLLMTLYGIVMVSGIYGLILQHYVPSLMKERLPAETVFEQIPHIRAQLYAAALKMRDSLKPVTPKQPDAGAPAASPAKSVTAGAAAMASTAGEISAPTARAKTAVGSTITAAPVSTPAATSKEATEKSVAAAAAASPPEPSSSPNAEKSSSPAPVATVPQARVPETEGTPTFRVPAPPGSASRSAVPAGDEPAAQSSPATTSPATVVAQSPAATTSSAPAPAPAPKPAAPAADLPSEEALTEFIERQILPYLSARRGEKFRLNNARFAEETFRFVKLRVAESYRTRVEEIQAWCDERRMLDLQTRLQHWLHGWLFVHVPFSFLLLILTVWHAFVTLFYY